MCLATVFRFSIFIILSAGLALSGCSKSDSDASSSLFVNFGPNGGIKVRTANNLPVGEQDPTDWVLDGAWNASERKLFQSLNLDLNGPAQNQGRATGVFVGGYPNPTAGQVAFSYAMPTPVSCRLVMVDKFYQVLKEVNTPGVSANFTVQLDVSGGPFRQGQLFRVYYVMYAGATLYYKGHGDIKVE